MTSAEFEPNNNDEMWTLESPQTYRNMGFWNEATQEGILDTHLAVGGIGGAGYLYSVEAAHMGVQNFSIADPEDFEDVNSNRVLGAHTETFGVNKAEVLADEIHRINPAANVRLYNRGISPQNLEEFMEDADLVLDATELSMPELGTIIAVQARKQEVPVLNAEYVAHGAQVTSFDPHSKWTFEKVMGIKHSKNASLEEIAEEVKDQQIPTERYLAYVPKYGDLKTLKAINEGAPLPSNMIGAGLAAQMAVAETVKHVRSRIGEKGLEPVYAPQVRWMDAYTGESGSTRHPRASFYRHVAVTAFRNMIGQYEPGSYTVDQRAARGDR